jgi:LacI family transcriptional regulator, galactose operon repressor
VTPTPPRQRPGRVRLADVAAAAGVDASTASRVLRNEKQRITGDTRARILRAAADLGYVANANARSLRSSRTMTLGLLVPNVAGAVYADVIRGATVAARQAGYVMVLIDASEIGTASDAFHRLILEGRVDGMLIASGTVTDSLDDELLVDSGRCVIVNRQIRGGLPSVIEDDEAGMRLGVDELIRLGHRRIACLAGPSDVDTSRRRLAGYRAAMSAAGLRIPRAYVDQAGYTEQDGFAGMQRLLGQPVAPTAVASASIAASVGALAACRENGVEVPRDLSIISFHDAPLAGFLSPPLTAVHMPLEELGAQAARLLIELLDGDPVPRTLKVTEPAPRLVARGSTTAPTA